MAQASDMLSFNVDQGASSNVAEASRAAAVLAFLVQPPGKVASLANEVCRLTLIRILACLMLTYVLFWSTWFGSGEPHKQFNSENNICVGMNERMRTNSRSCHAVRGSCCHAVIDCCVLFK